MHEGILNIFFSGIIVMISLLVTIVNSQKQKNAKKLEDAIRERSNTRQREFKYTMIDSQEDYLFKNSTDEVQYYSDEEKNFVEYEDEQDYCNSISNISLDSVDTSVEKSFGRQNTSKKSKAHSLRRAIILSEILGKPKSIN